MVEFLFGFVAGGFVIWFFKDWVKGLFTKIEDSTDL